MGLAFFSVPSAIDCVAFTPPPPPRPPAILTRNHSPGTDSGTQESTFVWKCVICKFFSFFCIRSLVRLSPGFINTNGVCFMLKDSPRTYKWNTEARSKTILPLKSNKHYIFWACVCVFSGLYPARKAHALYYIVICGLSDSVIFFLVIS